MALQPGGNASAALCLRPAALALERGYGATATSELTGTRLFWLAGPFDSHQGDPELRRLTWCSAQKKPVGGINLSRAALTEPFTPLVVPVLAAFYFYMTEIRTVTTRRRKRDEISASIRPYEKQLSQAEQPNAVSHFG